MTESSDQSDAEILRLVMLRRRRTVLDTRLYVEYDDSKLPIVYSPAYNIHFLGLEKFHPFDAQKWGNVVDKLIVDEVLTKDQLIEPMEATFEDLRVVHSNSYLKSLNSSFTVARAVEISFVAILPHCIIDKSLLKPMRLQTGGTILAAKVALERKYAINIGGGFHHANANEGGGFCLYADITLAIQYLLLTEEIGTAMIVDLDAHQGNGHENDFMDDNRVYIFDMFNYTIYPGDFRAKEAIKRAVRLKRHTEDNEYLFELHKNLKAALDEFKPDLIVYNAGTDVLKGDPLGNLDITSNGVIKRDEFVFKMAKEYEVPIVMVTSGGYTSKSAKVIADSITNLLKKFINV